MNNIWNSIARSKEKTRQVMKDILSTREPWNFKLDTKLPPFKNLCDFKRNVWPVIRKRTSSPNPVENFGLRGRVDIISYYPEYENQIKQTFNKGLSVKDNWLNGAPGSEQIGLHNKIEAGYIDSAILLALDAFNSEWNRWNPLITLPQRPFGTSIYYDSPTHGSKYRQYHMWWWQTDAETAGEVASFNIDIPLTDSESTSTPHGEPNFTDENSNYKINHIELPISSRQPFFTKELNAGRTEFLNDDSQHLISIPFIYADGGNLSKKITFKDGDYVGRVLNYDGRDRHNIVISNPRSLPGTPDDVAVFSDINIQGNLTSPIISPLIPFSKILLDTPIEKQSTFKLGIIWKLEYGQC